MISVDEALERVLAHARAKPPQPTSLTDALGLVLASAVHSDIDSPPWDKSIVDGYAVRSADLSDGSARLRVVDEVFAGAVATRAVGPGEAIRIMTGAPIPDGCDLVVMVETTELLAGEGLGTVVIRNAPSESGRNILPRGCAMRQGDEVLAAGTLLGAAEIGLLAEVGRAQVSVYPRPSVAVLATGNEIVEPHQVPQPGQIRNSNGPMLAALVAAAGGAPVALGVARDEHDDLRRRIERGLESDVLVLSGGVSAGVLDLVPGVLAECGVREVFHKVQLKPGKPLWFGVLPAHGIDKPVFGLPGNPVSSLVCFELFVRPALDVLAGRPAVGLPRRRARLTVQHEIQGNRPTLHPAHLNDTEEGWTVTPARWRGSADLRALAGTNALLHFADGGRVYEAGEMLEVLAR